MGHQNSSFSLTRLFTRTGREILATIFVIAGLVALESPHAQEIQTPAPVGPALGRSTLADYFDMLASGNYETAELMWGEATQERATRFPIRFTGIPVKVDAASPIVRNLPGMIDFLMPAARQVDMLAVDSFCRMRFENLANGRVVRHIYFARTTARGSWLVAPQDYYARAWETRETKYYRLHVDSGAVRFLNPKILALADKQVVALADSLKLTPAQLALIADKKIEFYFCSSDSIVHLMTGAQTRGLLDLGTNDLISATFPHDHELIHLLVNIKLGDIPLYTLPLMREGLAVYYGGRWAKAATALTDLGVFLHRENLASVDSLLTLDDFDRVGADIAYPVSGLFYGYLRGKLGLDVALALYRRLSGDFESINRLTPDSVRQIIVTESKSANWETVLKEFDTYCQAQISVRASAQPGKGKGSAVLKQENWTITKDKNWLMAVFQGTQGTPPKGSIFLSPDTSLAQTTSEQLSAQYNGDSNNDGYRYLIRVDQYEAGLYDLGTGQLTAKYIWGMSPSPNYYDSATAQIAIKFRLSMFDKEALKKPGPALLRQE